MNMHTKSSLLDWLIGYGPGSPAISYLYDHVYVLKISYSATHFEIYTNLAYSIVE